jgi:hypothetical protein
MAETTENTPKDPPGLPGLENGQCQGRDPAVSPSGVFPVRISIGGPGAVPDHGAVLVRGMTLAGPSAALRMFKKRGSIIRHILFSHMFKNLLFTDESNSPIPAAMSKT